MGFSHSGQIGVFIELVAIIVLQLFLRPQWIVGTLWNCLGTDVESGVDVSHRDSRSGHTAAAVHS
jgi:hypothetical protein